MLYSVVCGCTPANLPVSAFQDLRTIELTPVAGWTFNYNINAHLIKTTIAGAGTATQANGMAVLSTNNSANSSAKIETIKLVRYSPGLGALIRFTAVFTSGVAGSSQIIGLGDTDDGFFFGYNGASFGVLRRQNGIDHWTYQADWNVDRMNGEGVSGVTLDTTKGNVYSIRYQWLGYGLISFYVENPTSGEMQLVHKIQYANADTVPSVYNPSFPIMAIVENVSNSTDIILKTSSAMAFIEGNAYNDAITTRNCVYSSKTGISTETSILSIKNKETFQGKKNKASVRPDIISVSVRGSNPVVIKLILNATLGGTPVWTDINTENSVVQYDTSATTISGGILLAVIEVEPNGGRDYLFDSYNIILSPGNVLTFSATSPTNAQVFQSVSWRELW